MGRQNDHFGTRSQGRLGQIVQYVGVRCASGESPVGLQQKRADATPRQSGSDLIQAIRPTAVTTGLAVGIEESGPADPPSSDV